MPSPAPTHFVYGSLTRRGDPASRQPLAEGGRFLEQGSIQARLYVADGWPAAVPSNDPSERVEGELYELKDEHGILAQLDAWEGPGYERQRLPVQAKEAASTQVAWVWTWTGPVDEATRIKGGYWKGETR
jgi:gamma-glutamylcyclotransferase (GGCT)/AIG2-like uncharacterized protein YtfP